MACISFIMIVLCITSSAWSAAFPRQYSTLHHRLSSARHHHAHAKRMPSSTDQEAGAPTPSPTGSPSPSTTVHITNNGDFALLLPGSPGGDISDAEGNAVSFCYGSSGCAKTMPEGFITGANVIKQTHWIQVTGCIDPSKHQLSKDDGGGQFDVRYPQGAQCTFGGYGSSFIEQIEPSASRFCLRCCFDANDQTNCNSHHDREGCLIAVPGVYSFANGVSCDR